MISSWQRSSFKTSIAEICRSPVGLPFTWAGFLHLPWGRFKMLPGRSMPGVCAHTQSEWAVQRATVKLVLWRHWIHLRYICIRWGQRTNLTLPSWCAGPRFRPKSAVQQVVAGQCYVQFRAFDGRRKRHQGPFRSLVDFTFTMQLLFHVIEFVKNLTLRPKSCDKFFYQFLAEIVQLWLRWPLEGIVVQTFGCLHGETGEAIKKSEVLKR